MKRNKFSLSNYRLLSCNQGQLVPIGMTEVLPGDTFKQHTSALIRVAPLQTPVMHPCHVAIRHFFVPHRIVWDDFADKFITGGPNGAAAIVHPYVTIPAGGFDVGSLADYLGVPTQLGAGQTVSAIPFRAYNAICNEYFRDKQLQAERVVSKGNGADTTTTTTMHNVNWEKDYFTTSRPEPQLGPEVTISLIGQAPVRGIGVGTGTPGGSVNVWEAGKTTTTNYANAWTSADYRIKAQGSGISGPSNVPQIFADLSAVSGISIDDIRQAFSTQRFQEHRSRFGDTYVEYLRYLGVTCSDSRLQLPEYLGGSKQTIQFSEVLGTADTNLGDLGGHGIATSRTPKYLRSFEEHGYVMTLMYVRPKTVYMNGLPRTWSRTTKEDYWQKEFEHTGQQDVLNKEVYLGHTTPAGEFGYQDVYDEYRRTESGVSGEFRTTLKDWHMARDITTDGGATLDGNFVKADPTNRVYKATTANQLYIMASHQIRARRLIAKTGSSFTY